MSRNRARARGATDELESDTRSRRRTSTASGRTALAAAAPTEREVGAARDPYEREAERVARGVISSIGSAAAQRQSVEDGELLQGKFLSRPRETARDQRLRESPPTARHISRTRPHPHPVGRRPLQRLTVENTRFGDTMAIRVVQAGASGKVAEFFDHGPDTVMVKVGQTFGNEMVLGASLHSAMDAKVGDTKGFRGTAPEARLATSREIDEMKYLVTTDRLKTPPKNFVTGLNSGGQVLISKGMGGVNVNTALGGTAAPQHGQLDPNSLASVLVGGSGPLKVLGQHAVVDVFMGMGDRVLTYFNPENFKYDDAANAFYFVDNVKDSPVATFVRKQTADGVQAGHSSFNHWAKAEGGYVNATVNGRLDDHLFARIFDELAGIGADLPQHSKAIFKNAVTANEATLRRALRDGVSKGMKTMRSLVKNPLVLTSGIPEPSARFQSIQALLARSYFLFDNAHPEVAWEKATGRARVLLPGVAG